MDYQLSLSHDAKLNLATSRLDEEASISRSRFFSTIVQLHAESPIRAFHGAYTHAAGMPRNSFSGDLRSFIIFHTLCLSALNLGRVSV